MRVQIERCDPAYKDAEQKQPDGFQGQGGWVPAYKIEGHALDALPAERVDVGAYVYLKGNFKSAPVAGTVEDFAPKLRDDGSGRAKSFPDGTHADGSKLWRMLVERAKQGQQAPSGARSAPNPAGGSPATARAAVAAPTVSEALAAYAALWQRGTQMALRVFPGMDGPEAREHGRAIATHVTISLARSEMRPDPTEAEKAAAEAEKQRRLDEAKRLVEEAQKQQALAAMPAMAQGDDSDIPF